LLVVRWGQPLTTLRSTAFQDELPAFGAHPDSKPVGLCPTAIVWLKCSPHDLTPFVLPAYGKFQSYRKPTAVVKLPSIKALARREDLPGLRETQASSLLSARRRGSKTGNSY